MKKILQILLIVPLFAFFLKDSNKELIGTWELKQITLNDDTIFFRGKFEYTLQHNFELNMNKISNKEDSLAIKKIAEDGFQNSMSIKMEFLNDSSFKMTKIRSGGRISPNEIDSGTFELRNDTLIMTNQSRRNYKMMFLVDLKNKRIYQKDGTPNFIVYQEYIKTK